MARIRFRAWLNRSAVFLRPNFNHIHRMAPKTICRRELHSMPKFSRITRPLFVFANANLVHQWSRNLFFQVPIRAVL
jgi:hypothetical protein